VSRFPQCLNQEDGTDPPTAIEESIRGVEEALVPDSPFRDGLESRTTSA